MTGVKNIDVGIIDGIIKTIVPAENIMAAVIEALLLSKMLLIRDSSNPHTKSTTLKTRIDTNR
jgi:hypothetical protein